MTDTLNPREVLERKAPLVLFAYFEPVAGLDRFQPAGFPEVGHVIYKAPRNNGTFEHVCIVDSAASMANHLESLCMRGAHDYELVDELQGMPYLRCVTGEFQDGILPPDRREVVVTSLTEGHRIASTYFLEGFVLDENGRLAPQASSGPAKSKKAKGQTTKEALPTFGDRLASEFGIVLNGTSRAHPPADKWWSVFSTLFRYDPNALVHGVLFPQWQIKIARALTAHLEAFGASRVDRAGVKFDRLGKTTSGQPIFAVDDATAREIRAAFVLDTALIRSFGRSRDGKMLGLRIEQKEFLIALALWKIQRLCARPFRFRSGCHLQCVRLTDEEGREISIQVDIRQAIDAAGFDNPRVTDIYWPREELYRAEKTEEMKAGPADTEEGEAGSDEEDNE